MSGAADPLALDVRTRLPDALRVLVEEHPRDDWDADPGFNALIRFWLDRHMMFRRIVERLGAETEAALDGGDPARFGQALSRLGSTLVGELQMHHRIEDVHYFPVLAGKDARVSRGFEILDRDHHLLDARLEGFVTGANGVLGRLRDSDDPRTDVAGFRPALTDLSRLLDRHLEDEEELVVPVILKHGTAGLE